MVPLNIYIWSGYIHIWSGSSIIPQKISVQKKNTVLKLEYFINDFEMHGVSWV